MSDYRGPGCCETGDDYLYWAPDEKWAFGRGHVEAWIMTFEEGYLECRFCPACGKRLEPPTPAVDPLATRVEVAAPELTFNDVVVANGYSPCP